MGLPFWLINPLIYVLSASVWIINSSLQLVYESKIPLPNIFFLSVISLCYTLVHVNLTLMEHILVRGSSVCVCFRHMEL